MPDILRKLGLRSVMIEGGSRVLSSFMRSPPRSDGSPVVDSVIITVAPMFIGDGVGVVPKVSISKSGCPGGADTSRRTNLFYRFLRLHIQKPWAKTQ